MPAIRLDHVAKIYKNRKKGVSATLEVDFTIKQGEFVFVIGGHGAGKTTLMEIISGELEPDRGAVYLDEVDMTSANRREKALLRGYMGVVSQDYELKKTETVFKNLASESRLEYLKDRFFYRDVFDKALALVGMPGCGDQYPSALTVSECRRVELARAIVHSPSILVLDGITERADDETVWDLLHLLSELNSRGTTVIISTCDNPFVSIMNKRVIALSEGKVASDVRRGKYGYFG